MEVRMEKKKKNSPAYSLLHVSRQPESEHGLMAAREAKAGTKTIKMTIN